MFFLEPNIATPLHHCESAQLLIMPMASSPEGIYALHCSCYMLQPRGGLHQEVNSTLILALLLGKLEGLLTNDC